MDDGRLGMERQTERHQYSQRGSSRTCISFDVLAVRAGQLLFDFRNIGSTSGMMDTAGYPMEQGGAVQGGALLSVAGIRH